MIKPLGNRILVKGIEKKIDSGLIIIPESVNKDKPKRFEVLAIGDGEKAQELNIEVGSTVILNRFAGSEIEDTVDGEEIIVKIVLADDVQGAVCD